DPTPACAAGTAAPTARNLDATATPYCWPSADRAAIEKVMAGQATHGRVRAPGSVRHVRIGGLTGGGDCPGLNAVIRAVVRKGVQQYGHEFVGFRDGWKGPLEGLTMPLDVAAVRGILPRGGTILGSSRTNPVKVDGGVERIEENLAGLGVDALVAIG